MHASPTKIKDFYQKLLHVSQQYYLSNFISVELFCFGPIHLFRPSNIPKKNGPFPYLFFNSMQFLWHKSCHQFHLHNHSLELKASSSISSNSFRILSFNIFGFETNLKSSPFSQSTTFPVFRYQKP